MDWAAVVTMAAFSGEGLPGRRSGYDLTLSSGQPLFAEVGDEIGPSSTAKVRLAGADGQTLKKDSTQKRGTTLTNRMVPL